MKKSLWLIFVVFLIFSACSNQQMKNRKNKQMPPRGPIKFNFNTPTIKGYGSMHYFKNVAVQPDTSMNYKILFFIVKNTNPKKVNFGLNQIARMINLLRAAGVKQNHIHIVGIMTGKATDVALADSVYHRLYSVNNPNEKLLRELTKVGHTKIYVCSQVLGMMGYNGKYLNSYVKRALSAITTVTIYQLKGYAMLKF